MVTFVLVSGAHSGGWHWKQVARYLRAAGHEVYTPTLTGLGERRHLLTREVDLDTHLADVVNVLEFEDLDDVILVGASYGGIVVTGVAEQAAERLAHVVYLDAFVPEDGESMADMLAPEEVAYGEQLARDHGDGWRLPAPDLPHQTDHPIRTFYGKVWLRNPLAADVPRTYIACTETGWPTLQRMAERATAKGWRYRELPTGHLALETMPQELADLLLEVAAPTRPPLT